MVVEVNNINSFVFPYVDAGTSTQFRWLTTDLLADWFLGPCSIQCFVLIFEFISVVVSIETMNDSHEQDDDPDEEEKRFELVRDKETAGREGDSDFFEAKAASSTTTSGIPTTSEKEKSFTTTPKFEKIKSDVCTLLFGNFNF